MVQVKDQEEEKVIGIGVELKAEGVILKQLEALRQFYTQPIELQAQVYNGLRIDELYAEFLEISKEHNERVEHLANRLTARD